MLELNCSGKLLRQEFLNVVEVNRFTEKCSSGALDLTLVSNDEALINEGEAGS